MTEIFPTRAALRWVAENNTSWETVVADLAHPETNTPVHGSETRRRITGTFYTGYIEPMVANAQDAHLLVGLRLRERPAVAPGAEVVGKDTKAVRSSRSGGSGTRWPTEWPELVKRVNRDEQHCAERGKTHVIVYRQGRRVAALPCTSSDHRALMNACTQLRRLGLDVSTSGPG